MKSKHPFDATDFIEYNASFFQKNFETALDDAQKRLKVLIDSKEEPNFQNTIVALEEVSEPMSDLTSVFMALLSAETNSEMEAVSQTVLPMLSNFSNDIYLDSRLFEKVKAVQKSDQSHLSTEEKRLLELVYLSFARNGADLRRAEKEKLREIDEKLTLLSQKFGENIREARQAYVFNTKNEADLKSLPAREIEAAAELAKSKKLEGYAITLDYPSFVPALKYCEKRSLREELWRENAQIATLGKTSNRECLLEIVNLKSERARLLGEKTHAHYTLKERMAETPEKVITFLESLLPLASKKAKEEIEEVKSLSQLPDLKPWDFSFYSEKLKEKKYNFSEEEVRPYFRLENVVQGAFKHMEILYGLHLKERTDLPVYHGDVKVYEVTDSTKNDAFIGLLYADFFPRPSKQGGAWMTEIKGQGLFEGLVRRPHASIVCNFTKPTSTTPSLLGLVEVRTLFHELGHALHLLLSQCKYRSVSGTNVYWDFVELPSQIFENWTEEYESLKLYATHYQTGELIPESLVHKIKSVSRFQSGYQTLRQLNFCFLDFAWHMNPSTEMNDIEAFEEKITKRTSLFEKIPGTSVSCSFSHIFAGGYAAGYYSYKWAEVLDADAFEAFKEKGIFDKETALRFKREILERGGSEHPMQLYKNFRGREPDAKALLRRSGLLS